MGCPWISKQDATIVVMHAAVTLIALRLCIHVVMLMLYGSAQLILAFNAIYKLAEASADLQQQQ